MNVGLNTSQSGMNLANLRQDVVGNNLANVNTPEFKESRVNASEAPTGGVQADSISKFPEPGVDLAGQMVQMIQNSNSLGFNAQAIKTQDQMIGEILDLKS